MRKLGGILGWGVLALSLINISEGPAHAGFILAGTDSDDHGFASGGANQDGWLFMQRALENLAPGVTNGNKTVTILGSTSSALTAAQSAFNFSNLVGSGWTLQTVTTANFGTFFSSGINNAGILMMDSGPNIGGGIDGSSFVPHASAINTFVGNGGGLLSQANGYDWVTTLLPTLGVTEFSSSEPITLTAAGNAAFPGLTNADLSTGPWHNYFTNTGALPILGTSLVSGTTRTLIIGSSSGSITNPGVPGVPSVPGTPGGVVPEPSTILLFGTGLAALVAARRMKA